MCTETDIPPLDVTERSRLASRGTKAGMKGKVDGSGTINGRTKKPEIVPFVAFLLS